jgi:hypothetical protein
MGNGFHLLKSHNNTHITDFPRGRMSDARQHFHLGNEIIKAVGVTDEDIEECQKFNSTISNTRTQSDFLLVSIMFGHDSLSNAFFKKFTKTAKQLENNKTNIEVFIRKNKFLGFKLKD